MNKTFIIKNLFIFVIVFTVLIWGCKNGCNIKSDDDSLENDSTEQIDSMKSTLIEIGDALFSIPSPFQASMLIKDNGAVYNSELPNSTKKIGTYLTNFQKALNLGVYGADLGYATIFEQPQESMLYFESVEKLANDLGITSVFDAKVIKSIKSNIGNRDSLLVVVAEAYRASDEYLKNNSRTDVSSLILAGGWVESLNFMVNAAKIKHNQEIINRIGEQKNPLENLIKILTPYYDQPEYTQFIDNLIDLAYEFDGVDIKYNYVKPTVDVKNKITYINSTSEIHISEQQLNVISERIAKIRNQIIGNKL